MRKTVNLIAIIAILAFNAKPAEAGQVQSSANTFVQQSETGTPKRLNISISLPILPPLITEQKTGPIVDLLKAMAAEYKDGEVSIDVYPFARSLDNVIRGKADCHYPYLKSHNISNSDDDFYYTTEPFGKVIFVLYTNKNVKDLTPKNIMDKKFKVEIQIGHKEYLGNLPESVIDAGVQKVNLGRLDGYISSMDTCDPLIERLQLKNLKRQQFDTFEVAMICKKNDEGKQKEMIMTSLLKKLKENGTYDKIMGETNKRSQVFIPDKN